jgi:formate dehydrogenase subunit gamma
MMRPLIATVCVVFGMLGQVSAQTQAASVQSANIMDVQPEASTDPNYAQQSNGERSKVQPGNNAPMWRQVGSGVTGTSSLPKSEAPEAGNLIQPFVQYPGSRLTNAGEAWREVRNNWLIPYGGSFILIVLLAIAVFYWRVGCIKLHDKPTGRLIERFTPFERSAHMVNATAFSILAISGLVMAFGKFFLLPIIGTTLFGWLAYVLKNAHNFAGPLFAVSLVIVIITFVKDNIPSQRGRPRTGSLRQAACSRSMTIKCPGTDSMPVRKWSCSGGACICPGLVVVGSGLVMDKLVPGAGLYVRSDHAGRAHGAFAVSAHVTMVVLFMGHIYLGTAGVTEGAFDWYEDRLCG